MTLYTNSGSNVFIDKYVKIYLNSKYAVYFPLSKADKFYSTHRLNGYTIKRKGVIVRGVVLI